MIKYVERKLVGAGIKGWDSALTALEVSDLLRISNPFKSLFFYF